MNLRYPAAAALVAFCAMGPLASEDSNSKSPETSGQSAAVSRPPILGVAHIGLKTDDLNAARNFYGHVLGYQEPFTVDKPTGGLMLTYFKVNDHQYIEVFPSLKSATEDRLFECVGRRPRNRDREGLAVARISDATFSFLLCGFGCSSANCQLLRQAG
jgi:hypothetical protein